MVEINKDDLKKLLDELTLKLKDKNLDEDKRKDLKKQKNQIYYQLNKEKINKSQMEKYYKMDEEDRKNFNARCSVYNLKRYYNKTDEQYKEYLEKSKPYKRKWAQKHNQQLKIQQQQQFFEI
jgi:hypothetical protein